MRTTALADPFTKTFCVRIEPRYGSPPIYLTTYPTSLYVVDPGDANSVTEYLPEQGTEHSDYDMSQTFTPSVIEMKGVFGLYGITREKILRGDFDGARAYVFATSWKYPIKDEEPIGVFIFGKPKITDSSFTLELHHILEAFNAAPQLTYSKTCVNSFGDQTPDGYTIPLSFCRVDPSVAAMVESTITASFGPAEFEDSSTAALPTDWYGAGYMQFQTPENFWSKPFEIKSFNAGVFTLFENPLYEITTGTVYRARVGCRKRLIDCRDKFNNILGFEGTEGGFFAFNDIPNSEQSSKVGGFN